MKERPIIFSGDMVRAILEGRKTQTRRIIKPQPGSVADSTAFEGGGGFVDQTATDRDQLIWCPYGRRGDRLWVRETFAIGGPNTWAKIEKTINPERPHCEAAYYREGFNRSAPSWKPSIHMPRWASRITLEITGVRVERLLDMSEGDAMAEGCVPGDWNGSPFVPMKALWESIHGDDAWAANPWVWVIEFKRLPQ